MKLEIRKLLPELTRDYNDFFEQVAFSDNPEWSGCYCIWDHWNESLEAEQWALE